MRHLFLALFLVHLLAPTGCGAPPTPAAAQPALADPAAALARMAREPEGASRRPLIQEIRRAPAELALPALRAGLADPDPAMRAAAAIVAGRRRDGQTLAPEILALATGDAVVAVRVAASRGLASLRHTDAFVPLQQNLSDPSANVRLAALRALARIDAERAAKLPELGRLQLDPDARIAGAATKVSRGIALR